MIALYCRVSTDEQAQQGYSIENQRERLEAYCRSQGWTDYQFYIDDGFTGTNMDRPALKRMIRHIEQGLIQTVVVYKLDRLGRRQKDVLFLLEDIFDANGVTFKSATEPFDTSTPLGKAMLGILAVFAQLERDTIIERVTAGRRQRIRRGLWYGGRIPFGYRWNKEKQMLEVVPDEAELIREAYSRLLRGHSYLSIAEWLNSKTNVRIFTHNIVRDMLKRPIYAGYLNNDGVLVRGNHEAIVDMETFERAQKEIQRRKDGAPPTGDYLLSGLLRCGVCGSKVIHVIRHSKWNDKSKSYHYYACQARHVRRKDRPTSCTLPYKRMEEMDAWVSDAIKRISLNPDVVRQEIEKQVSVTDERLAVIEELEKALEDVNRKLERWYTAFEQGVIDPAQLKGRIDALEEEKRKILERLSEEDVPKEDNTTELIEELKTIGKAWDYLTFEERQEVLRIVINQIIIHPDREPEIIWNV